MRGSLLFTVIVFFRFILEFSFFSRRGDVVLFGDPYNVYHQFAFYTTVFLLAILLLHLFTKVPVSTLGNLTALVSPIILLPPLVDKLVLGRDSPYECLEPDKYLENFTTLFVRSGGAPGILLMLTVLICLSGLYAGFKSLQSSQRFRHAILIGLSTMVAIFLMLGIVGTIPYLVHISLRETGYFADHGLWCLDLLWLSAFSCGIGLILLFAHDRKATSLLLRGIRNPYLLFFPLVALFGLGISGILGSGIGSLFLGGSNPFREDSSLGLANLGDIPFVLLLLATVALGWIATSLAREMGRFNKHTKRGNVSQLAVLIGLATVALAALLGPVSAICVLLAMIASWAYLSPPLNLHDRIPSYGFVAIGSILSYFAGFYVTNVVQSALVLGCEISYPVTQAVPNINAVLLGFGVFFLGLIFPTLVKMIARRRVAESE